MKLYIPSTNVLCEFSALGFGIMRCQNRVWTKAVYWTIGRFWRLLPMFFIIAALASPSVLDYQTHRWHGWECGCSTEVFDRLRLLKKQNTSGYKIYSYAMIIFNRLWALNESSVFSLYKICSLLHHNALPLSMIPYLGSFSSLYEQSTRYI